MLMGARILSSPATTVYRDVYLFEMRCVWRRAIVETLRVVPNTLKQEYLLQCSAELPFSKQRSLVSIRPFHYSLNLVP
jgi:hypothetical protein